MVAFESFCVEPLRLAQLLIDVATESKVVRQSLSSAESTTLHNDPTVPSLAWSLHEPQCEFPGQSNQVVVPRLGDDEDALDW